jgi:hypothetical protein
VGSVLFLFFFIYSVMGMNLFGVVRDGEVLGKHANFKNFPEAMAALFRSATGERWNGIMVRACPGFPKLDDDLFTVQGHGHRGVTYGRSGLTDAVASVLVIFTT